MSKIIFFELNEVPYRIFDDYVKANPQSNFAALHRHSRQFTSYDEENERQKLSPWVTWSTLHRGVGKGVHHIYDFGQDLKGVDGEYPPVWQILTRNSVDTGVFSSLHTSEMPKNLDHYSFFMPDPFSPTPETYPKALEDFQKFNLVMSRASARTVKMGIDYGSALKVVTQSAKLGLRASTLAKVAGQLITERVDRDKKARRRSFQSILAFDLFFKLLQERKPSFCTFFSNHVASCMHRYWRAKYPDEYKNSPPLEEDNWVGRFGAEIDWAMGQADEWLGQLLDFVRLNPEYKLVVASSMGQAAQEFFKAASELCITDHVRFLKGLGVDPSVASEVPAMKPQFNFRFSSAGAMAQFKESLAKLKVKGESIRYRESDGFISMDLGYPDAGENAVSYDGRVVRLEDFGLVNYVNDELYSCTAYHIPDGIFMVHAPNETYNGARPRISTLEIAPALLANFGIAKRPYMVDPSFKV